MRNKILSIALLFTLCGMCATAQTRYLTQTDPEPDSTDRKQLDVEKLPMMDYSQQQRMYIVGDIDVHGVKYMDADILKTTAGLTSGDSIYLPGNYISQAITKLMNQSYFSDAKIGVEYRGDTVDLNVYLKERPRVYQWKFEGIRKGQATELLDELKLKRGASTLSDYIINKNITLIKKYFYDRGFQNAEVDVRIQNDSLINNAVNVTFVVDRKERVKIGEIEFAGNEVFSDRKLRSTFKKTHKKNFNFLKSSRLKETDYAEDKELLIDFYNSKGYRNANIVSDSIYPISENRIGIKLNVDEGNKYYFRNISFSGNSIYPTEDLLRVVGFRKGDTYDRKTLHKRLGIGREENPDDISSVKSSYQNAGYLMSQIDPTEVIVGEDSLDLEIKIFEGKPFTINDVTISGNMKVNDQVIRRELYTQPGELYNRALLMQTMRQLQQMQHFNPEAIAPNIQPVSNQLVDISWSLEETSSDRFEIAGGWGAGMFVGSVGIQLNNLSTRNFFKKGSWRPYPQGQNQQLAIRFQTNGTYYKSGSLSFTEPWLGGKKPISLTVSAYYSDESNAVYVWQTSSRHFRTFGLAAGIGRRLNWPDPYFQLYTELSYQAYNLKDWYDYFIIQNGTSHTFALKTVLSRSTVDQPIYPRSGSEFSISMTLTPPYSAFDKKDYSDPNMSDNDRYRWIEYHKWQLKGQWFYPLTNNQKLVMMAKAEMGYLGAYNRHKPSPFEGYDVGGDGMTNYTIYGVDVIGMRGYENSALNPISRTGDYARAYTKYAFELRYPFILKPSSTIYGIAFAEAGNAYSSWKNIRPFDVKRALGAGLRLYLPIVGMIGIDWGYGFDRAPGKTSRSGSHFHFLIGQQF